MIPFDTFSVQKSRFGTKSIPKTRFFAPKNTKNPYESTKKGRICVLFYCLFSEQFFLRKMGHTLKGIENERDNFSQNTEDGA